MLRLQHLIGLPVIEMNAGKLVGHVKDAWFDEHWQLGGIILDAGRRFLTAMKSVIWNEVMVCGEDAVIIMNEASVRKTKQAEIQRSFHTGSIRLKDLPVITVDGEQLGRVSDVYFDEIQGTQIVGYELTDGFIADIMEGRKWLPAPRQADDVMLGENVIIVPAGSEAFLSPVAVSESDIGRNE
ncbi:PRC-barrel domain-containing protein [Paenibacillus lignilyticus]|uniref:PRC-barrel domain-containing protein n=1 Tax=Paenibacillus lignilyticus TaxID=1172615 RepID=A0ABS5C617_9BACL|nr:PRC-barrel domain-containing protein [Paenibacillus lignilyticus]MBP3961353.1 PRC-barrel domain-containing protein [Paenibacillus lignilyticus]